MSIADPNKTILTGENPFIRLSLKDGDPNSTDASYWALPPLVPAFRHESPWGADLAPVSRAHSQIRPLRWGMEKWCARNLSTDQ